MERIKKLFGGIDLSWTKVIVLAIVTGIYTALMCVLPQVKDTSFDTITVSFEVWILFGIIIIMNSKSNMDSALKCFVFFLISQPLVYLLQVPFNSLGWRIFQYYGRWFVWTILCLPMGYIGYYIKKDKWWGYIILLPMILLTALSYRQYLSYFTYCRPCYILICIFCVVALLIYPYVLFNDKRIKTVGTLISVLIVIVLTVITFSQPLVYHADLFSTIDGKDITDEYKVSLTDEKYGDVSIRYIEEIDTYIVHADFKKKGNTVLIVNVPDGTEKRYDLNIELFDYEINEK